jgi:gluconokinase
MKMSTSLPNPAVQIWNAIGGPVRTHPLAINRIVVMGVSGCGKSTVGRTLAGRMGGDFVDADDLHSADAIEKMASGRPLTDEDRYPWLDRVGERLAMPTAPDRSVVVACSALRRVYRDRLRVAAGAPIVFVHLAGDLHLLRERVEERAGHFMPSSPLVSQLDTLESLEHDEDGITVSIAAAPAAIADAVELSLAALIETTVEDAAERSRR